MCLYNALDSETPLTQVILFANEEKCQRSGSHFPSADENGNATVFLAVRCGNQPSTTGPAHHVCFTTSSEVTYTVKYVDQISQLAGVTRPVHRDDTTAPPISCRTVCGLHPAPPYAYEIQSNPRAEGEYSRSPLSGMRCSSLMVFWAEFLRVKRHGYTRSPAALPRGRDDDRVKEKVMVFVVT